MSGGEEFLFHGGTSSDTFVSSTGNELVEGTASDTTIGNGGYEYVDLNGSAIGTVIDSGGTEVISTGGSATDTTVELGGSIEVSFVNYVNGEVFATVGPSDVLSVTSAGTVVYTEQLVGDYTGITFETSLDPLNGTGTQITAEETPCYCRGTLIRTDRGEVAVEDLRIGDRLVTLSGAARPIRWIGRRSYSGRFASGNRKVLPILFRPGALADGAPRRDLFVSPQHAMFVDDVLIPASALVNGSSIVQLEAVDAVEYFHLELDTHDVILAEGAAAESFVDDDSRGIFQNAAEYRLLYPDALRAPARFCAPRVEDGAALEAVRRRLAARAGAAPDAGALCFARDACAVIVDHVGRGPDRSAGRADAATPGQPVRLRIIDNDAVIGAVVAGLHRDDLRRAGIGDGCHAFEFTVPGGLSPHLRHVIRVERAADGEDLTNSPWMVAATPLVLTASETAQGELRGKLDMASRDRIIGWAQDAVGPRHTRDAADPRQWRAGDMCGCKPRARRPGGGWHRHGPARLRRHHPWRPVASGAPCYPAQARIRTVPRFPARRR